MHAVRRFLVKQTISPAESMRAQLSLEVVDLALVVAKISFARQMFQPDRVQLQSAQAEHPLQWNRKIAATLEIFRRKPAAEENRHASRVVILLACSSAKMAIMPVRLDLKRTVRVAGAPCLAADDRCRILRSGSA